MAKSSVCLPLPQKVKTCNGSYLGQNLAAMVKKVTNIEPFFF